MRWSLEWRVEDDGAIRIDSAHGIQVRFVVFVASVWLLVTPLWVLAVSLPDELPPWWAPALWLTAAGALGLGFSLLWPRRVVILDSRRKEVRLAWRCFGRLVGMSCQPMGAAGSLSLKDERWTLVEHAGSCVLRIELGSWTSPSWRDDHETLNGLAVVLGEDLGVALEDETAAARNRVAAQSFAETQGWPAPPLVTLRTLLIPTPTGFIFQVPVLRSWPRRLAMVLAGSLFIMVVVSFVPGWTGVALADSIPQLAILLLVFSAGTTLPWREARVDVAPGELSLEGETVEGKLRVHVTDVSAGTEHATLVGLSAGKAAFGLRCHLVEEEAAWVASAMNGVLVTPRVPASAA